MISPNPYERSQRSRRRSWRVPVFGALSAALLLVLVLLWQHNIASVLWQIGAPVLRVRNTIEQSRVSELEAELASTTAALSDRDALYNQNITLKNMLGRPQTASRVLGAVLERPPGLPYDTLMIDVGSEGGVVAGDLVFAGGTAAIGEVSDVYTATSRVSLFSAPGRTYDAQVTPKAAPGTVIPLTLAGQGAGSFLGEVPGNSSVIAGDSVVVPGIGNTFLGTITHVDAPAGSSFETLYVQLPVDIFSLQYVQVQTHV